MLVTKQILLSVDYCGNPEKSFKYLLIYQMKCKFSNHFNIKEMLISQKYLTYTVLEQFS